MFKIGDIVMSNGTDTDIISYQLIPNETYKVIHIYDEDFVSIEGNFKTKFYNRFQDELIVQNIHLKLAKPAILKEILNEDI